MPPVVARFAKEDPNLVPIPGWNPLLDHLDVFGDDAASLTGDLMTQILDPVPE